MTNKILSMVSLRSSRRRPLMRARAARVRVTALSLEAFDELLHAAAHQAERAAWVVSHRTQPPNVLEGGDDIADTCARATLHRADNKFVRLQRDLACRYRADDRRNADRAARQTNYAPANFFVF